MNNHDVGTLVSIIVRTKDRPKLLKRALESISAQTYRPIEVVLVNDGGCDLPEEELREILGDASLNYVRLQKNRGRAEAGNAGIENAQGNYIGFLDDDDELYPEHVVTLVSFLKQSDYKVAYTDAEVLYRDFDPEKKKTKDLSKTVLFSKIFSYEELLVGNYIPFMCLLFSREVFDKLDGAFDEKFDLYEDWDFLIRVGHKYPFYHIKKLTALYNQWSKELQINQANAKLMRSIHLKVINKHRDKITPEIILNMRHKKENLELLVEDFKKKFSYNYKKDSYKKDNYISQLEDTVRENTSHILQLSEEINRLSEEINRLNEEINEEINVRDNRVSQLELDLTLIKDTVGWKLLERFRKMRDKILPPGIRPGRIYDLPLKSFKVLKNDGIKVFFNKVKCKLKGGNNDKKTEAPVLLPSNIESSALTHFPSKKKYNILFLKCEWAGITNHYRVYNMVEYLKLKGIHAEVMDLYDLPFKVPYAYRFDLVVIHRVPMTQSLETFIRTCKEIKAVVIFDIDDYLFESSVIHQIEWIQHTKASEKEQLIEHIKQCRQTLKASDYFIGPTDFLSDKAENLVEKAYVIRNGFSRELLQTSLGVLEEKTSPKEDDTIRIGYFSGTNTHQKDFHVIAPVLLRILEEYDYVNLYICGLLELDDTFDSFLHRVEKSPFVPLDQLPYAISKVDLNIVPLAAGDFFSESKSELKYIYAGILKIPTVAASTDAFKYAIQHGENGFLASTGEEWYQCLKILIEDSALRKNMGEKAYFHVKNTYIPEVLAEKVKAVYENIIDDVRLKNNILGHSISVNFIVSDVIKNVDKYTKLVEIAEILIKSGHYVRLYFFKPADALPLDGPRKLFHDSKPFIIQGMDNILSSDVLVCTDPYNSSVIAYQNRERTANLVYLRMDENYDEISYKWSELFTEVPYFFDNSTIANNIENTAWGMTNLTKS